MLLSGKNIKRGKLDHDLRHLGEKISKLHHNFRSFVIGQNKSRTFRYPPTPAGLIQKRAMSTFFFEALQLELSEKKVFKWPNRSFRG